MPRCSWRTLGFSSRPPTAPHVASRSHSSGTSATARSSACRTARSWTGVTSARRACGECTEESNSASTSSTCPSPRRTGASVPPLGPWHPPWACGCPPRAAWRRRSSRRRSRGPPAWCPPQGACPRLPSPCRASPSASRAWVPRAAWISAWRSSTSPRLSRLTLKSWVPRRTRSATLSGRASVVRASARSARRTKPFCSRSSTRASVTAVMRVSCLSRRTPPPPTSRHCGNS
mmetsp:Transcript_36547/g.109137  ORF Transcript_36547/g.109137 Transcript_36547/m.109137 type:complete len:232 (+) Transcript_36547:1334-2029(+)